VDYIRAIELSMGDGIKEVNPATQAAKVKLARSLTSSRPIKRGEILSEDMLCLKSPGDGIKWVDKETLLGKTALYDIESDVTLILEDFD
jgi:sialic acid synthase